MKPRILIVDDDDAITQQLFWTLCDDYEVMTANDLPTAIRRATIYEPAISILDLHLPPVVDSPEGGLRILKYIKAHIKNTKVLVISCADSIETQKACYAAGADEFLDKPFETDQLRLAMRHMPTTAMVKESPKSKVQSPKSKVQSQSPKSKVQSPKSKVQFHVQKVRRTPLTLGFTLLVNRLRN